MNEQKKDDWKKDLPYCETVLENSQDVLSDYINGLKEDIELLKEQNKEMLDCILEEAKFQYEELDGCTDRLYFMIKKITGKPIEEVLKDE